MPNAAHFREQLSAIAPAIAAAGLAQAAVLWWTGWRGPLVLLTPCVWMGIVACVVVAARGFSQYVLSHPKIEARLTRKIAIIGDYEHAAYIQSHFASRARYGVDVTGIFADQPGPQAAARVSGSVDDLIAASRQSRVDAVIIALPPGRGDDIYVAGLVRRLRGVAADVLVVPYLMQGPNMLLPMQSIGPMSFTVLQRRPLNELQSLSKTIFDFVFCAIIVLPLSLFFLLVAIAIKLESPGPILFLQPRLGLNNRPFVIFKFRSMYLDQTDVLAVRQTSRRDPRVTRVGKWLRRLSIDEMPQIFNVLRGEMSLVGPRPHAPQTRIDGELLDDVLLDYIMRYHVKPGITGWAQVNGSRGQLVNATDLRKRVGYDLEYMRRWSLTFDLKIIALTIFREILSKHAY
jgi:Undecaprenyl-phosphate glucose phosphotransferase